MFKWIAVIMVIVCAASLAVIFFYRSPAVKKEAPPSWREDFLSVPGSAKGGAPKGWLLKEKPGTKRAVFSVAGNSKDGSFLHVEADRASASLVTKADSVDLTKTPILRWRWRVTALPEGADGRVMDKDDQAIGIYIGTGGVLNNKSISYRWDTDTPKKAEGSSLYGFGTIKVKWHTLRNKEDAAGGKWFVEERNVAEDFKKAWGFCPGVIYLSVACNSQYTGSRAAADLDWIEFASNGKAP